MKISLSSSLHLNHGEITPAFQAGGRLPTLAFVPVGLLCLKAYADGHGVDGDIRVTELNGLINAGVIPNDVDFYEHIVDAILQPDDDVAGLMTDADSLHHTVLIAERIKSRRPDTTVCLGGPGSSPVSAALMNTFPFIDFVVRGEGEETFVELLDSLQGRKSLPDIAGLTWRNNGRAMENLPRAVLPDLDTLPVPAFEAFDMSAGSPLYLDVGRGCPFKCQFCVTAPFWHRRYRMKSIGRIYEELCLVRDRYGRRAVNFSHDIFTCDREWTLEFCDYLIKNPPGVSWTCSTRTDIIDAEVLERMAEAGCKEIYYGIETGSPELQKEICKNLDLDWARDIVRTTSRVGIRPVTGFIVGYPTETYDTLRDTLHQFFEFLRVGRYRAHIFTLAPFLGAPLLEKHGVRALDRFAEYYDLPLSDDLVAVIVKLKRTHPEIFASTYRFTTPGVPARLIDASEELSAALSILRSLWPRLLPRYKSELEFYERWVGWIENYNNAQRPRTAYPHQAEVEDLLLFVEEEIERFRLAPNDPARDLLAYERLKLDARALPSPPRKHGKGVKRPERGPGEIDIDAVIERQNYLIAEFGHDIEALLAGEPVAEALVYDHPWVAVVKTDQELLTTVTLGTRAKRLLDLASERERVGDLIAKSDAGDSADSADAFDVYLRLIGKLVDAGLFVEVG